MKKFKINYYDSNIHDAVEYTDFELTDTEYERLERLAKLWKMTVPDAVRIMVANGLKTKEFDN